MQPTAEETPLYVKNTKTFIQKLNQVEETPDDSLFVTLDAKSLYTNSPNNKGIKTVKEAYDKPLIKPFRQKLSQLSQV